MHYKNYEEGRPLIFFLEAYVFSKFWGNLYILEFLIILMHAGCIFLIYKIAQRLGIKLNALSMLIMAFMPLVFEGLYWISASDRTVISLFLCLASIYIFLIADDEEKRYKKIAKIILACVLNLLCTGFYEQTIAVNFFVRHTCIFLCEKI